MRKDDYLTPNFQLGEFFGHNDNWVFFSSAETKYKKHILENLTNLAHRLQVLRDLWNKPIVITSGYRSPSYNKRVGGGTTSFHMHGMAADFFVRGMPVKDVAKELENWSGGLGTYSTWVHVDSRPTRARWNG